LVELFDHTSFLGRKLMNNFIKSKELLHYILQFLLACLYRIEAKPALYETVCEPMLHLVFRPYTDAQYEETEAKELSAEIVDHFNKALPKQVFINCYANV
jgi:hypothetical protein